MFHRYGLRQPKGIKPLAPSYTITDLGFSLRFRRDGILLGMTHRGYRVQWDAKKLGETFVSHDDAIAWIRAELAKTTKKRRKKVAM